MQPRQPTTGVLTFHRCINYGSYWQARCLVHALRAQGHAVVLLDHYSATVNRAEWRCALQPLLPAIAPQRDRLLYAVKVLKFWHAFASLPRSARFGLDEPTATEAYDLVIVGSDEVWNFTHPWYGHRALFFGEGLRARRLAAYAASFGNYPADWGLPPEWGARLRRFDALSVRDANSRTLIQNALELEPALVLDPSLLCPLPAEGRWRGPRTPFIAVYGHSFSPEFASRVQRAARARGLPLVSIGYRNDWAHRQWLTAGPQDFAHALARADAVVTNFFHGCVFAIHNGKPFVSEASDYRATKVHNLLSELGGAHHLLDAETPAAVYAERLAQPLAPSIGARVTELRGASAAYLQRVAA
jgi:hypothetical protein